MTFTLVLRLDVRYIGKYGRSVEMGTFYSGTSYMAYIGSTALAAPVEYAFIQKHRHGPSTVAHSNVYSRLLALTYRSLQGISTLWSQRFGPEKYDRG